MTFTNFLAFVQAYVVEVIRYIRHPESPKGSKIRLHVQKHGRVREGALKQGTSSPPIVIGHHHKGKGLMTMTQLEIYSS